MRLFTLVSFISFLHFFALQVQWNTGSELGFGSDNFKVASSDKKSVIEGDVKFTLSDMASPQSVETCIDLKVADFMDIQSFQYAIEYDQSSLNFGSFQNFSMDIPDLEGSIAYIEPGLLRVSWFDFGGSGISLEDQEVLCQLCFEVTGEVGNTTQIQFTDNISGGIEVTNVNNEILPYILETGSISIEGACSASAEYPERSCVDEVVSFIANPVVEVPEGNTNPINGYWIIDMEVITSDKIDQTLGSPGKEFKVISVADVSNVNFFENIEIEFTNPGSYQLQYYYDFTSCSDTVDFEPIQVSELPPEILPDMTVNACYGEDAIVDLAITGSSIYVATYELNGEQLVDTFSSSMGFIGIENVEESVTVKFINLIDTVSQCVLSFFENEYVIDPFDPLSIQNLQDSCVTNEGQYYSEHLLEGGSGSYQFVSSVAGGVIEDNVYIAQALALGKPDTLLVRDTFCLSPFFEFPLTNTCACADTSAMFDNSNIYEACETAIIELELEQSSKSTNSATESILRTYEKNGTEITFLDELIIDNENEAVIPYIDDYTNGKNYFARSYITSVDESGVVNYNDFCIDSSSQEIIFRFFQNPDAEIFGETEVCRNQSEVLFQPIPIQSNTSYEWEVASNAEVVEVGDQIYVHFLESGNSTIELNQTYFPQISATGLSCFGNAVLNVNVTTDEAPERSDIVFFEPNLLSLSTTEDYCIQWFSVDKETGMRTEFGTEKQWQVAEFDPNEFFYGVETKFPIDGNCDFDGYCETTQFYNKGPITGISEDHTAFMSNFRLFPNPTNGILNLAIVNGTSNDIGSVNLYNVLGEKQKVIQHRNTNIVSLDVSDCQPGIHYMLIFDRNQERKTIQKVVIK